MLRPLAAALVLAAMLSACDGSKEGTTISINATDAESNVSTNVDGRSGAVSINAPGFTGEIKLPRLHLGAGDFDMNGVHLYPGSTISGMNIDAHDGGKAGDDDDSGTVRVSFTSPAAPATVRRWFQEKLGAAGFTLAAKDNGLVGTTDKKKPFTLELTPDGADQSKGIITIS